ncbi:MAG: glycosyltransferase family 2 protein [Acidimicrobiia bacterium]|nr:glycosyltransferase family 2 protein [Acidimicrobiia bacterium]
MTPALSIIIVSFNTRAHLQRCLISLQQPPPQVSHEIIVVENASTDGSADAARRFPGVHVIDAGENLGFSAANNRGIRASRGTNLLLLNSDTIVPPGAIDVLMGVLERHPDATVVGPRLVDGQGRAELSFGPMIGPLAEFRQGRLMRRLAAGDVATVARIEAWTRQEGWPDWVTGACLLVRRAAAEAVGLLDERFFMYTEDVDFCAAIRARGGRVLFTPVPEIVHVGGRSKATALQATQAAYRRSHLAFYEKHHPRWALLLRWYTRVRDR